MAPTDRLRFQAASPILNRVQSGRIGHSTSNRKYVKKNQGRELLPATKNQDKELFPAARNANKKLFPGIFHKPLSKASLSQSTTCKQFITPIRPSQIVRNHVENATPSRAVFKRSRKQSKGRALLAVQTVNLEQRRAKQVRDNTIKRLQALQSNPNHIVEDARNAKTIPYTAARLDMNPNTSTTKNKKLSFSIAVGFWAYTPTFTPVKIFSLSTERFSNVQGLARLIFGNTDVQKAVAGVGIDVGMTVFVGYEMSFPKGYRFVQDGAINGARDCAVPFQTVPSDRCALVNTDCALREFFWQVEHYALDEQGNVLVQMTARIAMAENQMSGGIGFKKFETQWRNTEEKQWEAEEKRQMLEKQSFAFGAEKRDLKQRMEAIEERAQRAMENAKASKEEPEKANVSQSQFALISGDTLQLLTHISGTEAEDGEIDKSRSEIELNLDIEFD